MYLHYHIHFYLHRLLLTQMREREREREREFAFFSHLKLDNNNRFVNTFTGLSERQILDPTLLWSVELTFHDK
jgi:hypothetical protein